MSTARCFSLVGGVVLRVTKVDPCGLPVYGDCSSATSDAFVTLTFTAQVDDGNEIDVKNANGKTCVNQPACPTFKGYQVEGEFCSVDPDLFGLMTSQESILSAIDGAAIGFDVKTGVDACDTGFALEAWSNIPGQSCGPSGRVAYGYLLLPFLQGGIISDFTLQNDAVNFTIGNAMTKNGSGWGQGPYLVQDDGTGQATSLVTPVSSKSHLRVMQTLVPPPEVICGCVPLDDPAAPVVTGATAGSPGTWEPQPSNRPDNLAALQTHTPAITATPTTAWAAEEFVILEDGSGATWDGTAWAEWTE
jgi:hypothetical protein